MSSMTAHAGTLCTQSHRCGSVKTTTLPVSRLCVNYSFKYTLNPKTYLQHTKAAAGSDDIQCIVIIKKSICNCCQTDTIYSSDFFPLNRQKTCCLCIFYLLTPKYINSTSETTQTLSRNHSKR